MGTKLKSEMNQSLITFNSYKGTCGSSSSHEASEIRYFPKAFIDYPNLPKPHQKRSHLTKWIPKLPIWSMSVTSHPLCQKEESAILHLPKKKKRKKKRNWKLRFQEGIASSISIEEGMHMAPSHEQNLRYSTFPYGIPRHTPSTRRKQESLWYPRISEHFFCCPKRQCIISRWRQSPCRCQTFIIIPQGY